MRALRYGSCFTDRSCGLTVAGHHPAQAPELWARYLEGARERYRQMGLEHVVRAETIGHGQSTPLFWVVWDADRIVGGLRIHGPLRTAEQAAALDEVGVDPGRAALAHAIEERAAEGVLEPKGLWVTRRHRHAAAISAALARCHIHALHWLGARFGLCTAAGHTERLIRASGGRPDATVGSFIYPDDRFVSQAFWWDRQRLALDAQAAQLALLGEELDQLRASSRSCASRMSAGGVHAPEHAGVAAAATGDGGGATESWRPVLIPDDRSADDRIAALRADPTVTVQDHLPIQQRELLALRPECPEQLRTETPRWAYFPWRRTAVRLLGPAGFRRLRLDRNRHKITLPEQEELLARTIGIIGLSVGHAIAHALALEGLAGRLVLADFDRLELSNLNRVPATVLDLDVPKVVVAARRVAELDPYLDVEVWPDGVGRDTLDAFCEQVDVVVEECDSLDVKLLVREAARRHRRPVVMETSDRGLLDIERFDAEPDRPVFHGLVDDLSADDLGGLPAREKAAGALRILEPAQLSARLAASLAEIEETVTTWPQLGGDVLLGGATAAAAVRALVRGPQPPSGRTRIDLDAQVGDLADPRDAEEPDRVIDVRVSREPPPEDPLLALAHAAHQAPSGGNMQPWRFALEDQRLHLRRGGGEQVALDVAGRGTDVALGAALENARIAASARGALGPVRLLPDPADPDLIATLELGEDLDSGRAALHDAMLARHTNRRPGSPQPLGEGVGAGLEQAARSAGARLRLLEDPAEVARCAELMSASDRLRYLSPWLHEQLLGELRWPGHDDLSVGLDVRTLELDAAEQAMLQVARRRDVTEQLASWDGGVALGRLTRDRVASSSAMALITVDDARTVSYLRGGAAMERVWIAAEQAGLAVQPVAPTSLYAVEPVEHAQLVPETLRAPLREVTHWLRALFGLVEGEQTAMLLRLAHAPPATVRSARQPLEAVLQRAGDAEPSPTRRRRVHDAAS